MTNPFFELSEQIKKEEEEKNPFFALSKTTQPLSPIQRAPGEIGAAFSGAAVGMLDAVKKPVDWLAKGAQTPDAPILGIADKLGAFSNMLTPKLDTKEEEQAFSGGRFVGSMVPAIGVFGKTQKATESALEVVAPRALDRIAKTAASTTGKNWAGAMARSVPANTIAGVAGTAIVDPESIDSANGLLLAGGLSAAGSIFALNRGRNWQAVPDDALPHYERNIERVLSSGPETKTPTASELIDKAKIHLIDSKAGIKKTFPEKATTLDEHGKEIPLPMHKNPNALVTTLSGSGGRQNAAINGDGIAIINDSGERVLLSESLAKITSPLKNMDEVKQTERVAIAMHTVSEGVQSKIKLRQEEIQRAINAAPQGVVKFVKEAFENNEGVDAAIKKIKASVLYPPGTKLDEQEISTIYKNFYSLKHVEKEFTGVSKEDALQLLENAPDHVKKVAEGWTNYRHSLLQYMQMKGMLSEETAAKWIETYDSYVSLERVFNNARDVGKKKNVFTEFLGTKLPSSFKAQTGSKELIKRPLESTIEQTRIAIKRADENEVLLAMKKIVDEGDKDYWRNHFEIISDAQQSSDEYLEGIADSFIQTSKEAGIKMTRQEAREMAAVMSPTSLRPDANVINFFENGKLMSARVSPEIAMAVRSMGPQDLNMFVQIMGLPARALRTGVTLSGDFMFFNLIADTFSGILKSEHGFTPMHVGKGLMEAIKDTGFIRRFSGQEAIKNTLLGQKLGAGAGSAIRQEALTGGVGMGTISTSKQLADDALIRTVIPQSGSQRVYNVVRHPIEALTSIAKPIEEAARIGEYMAARGAGKDIVSAALAYRKVTTDFAQQGLSMKALSHMTAFLNPAIQSIANDTKAVFGRGVPEGAKRIVIPSKAVPSFKIGDIDMPIFDGTSKDITKFMYGVKGAAGLTVKGFGALSLPSALLWAANRNDQEINDLRKSPSGKIYWHVRKDDDTILRIRKPFLFGQIFATGIESALDRVAERDPKAAESWVAGMMQQAKITAIPNAAMIFTNIVANKDWHTGAPIVPSEQQGVDPQFQGTAQTSTLSKLIVEATRKASLGKVNISPIQMDYVIRSSTGSLGSTTAKSLDYVLPSTGISGAAPTKTDLPMVGRLFARYPSQSVEPVRTFYDNLNKAEQVVKTAAFLEEKNPEKLATWIETNAEAFALAPILTETKHQLADIRHTIDEIVSAPDELISREEKRIYSDMYTRQIIEITRAVNQSLAGITIR